MLRMFELNFELLTSLVGEDRVVLEFELFFKKLAYLLEWSGGLSYKFPYNTGYDILYNFIFCLGLISTDKNLDAISFQDFLL